MNFSLKQLEAFVWVADLGSFRRAADRLNTTQPNISARIASLESVLDTILMERDAGSVRLTHDGKILLDHARTVLSATDKLVAATKKDSLIDGVLRLGVTEMIVHTWLRDYLRILKERFPHLTVELTVDLSANLNTDLFERSIDLAIHNGPFDRQTSHSVDLGIYPLIWIASPQLGFARNKQTTLAQLCHFPILTHARGTQPFIEVSKHFANQRSFQVRLTPSSNLAACIHMAIDGFGVATVPAAMATEEIGRGQLMIVDYPWRPKSLQFAARYHGEQAPSFIAFAAGIAGEVSSDFIQQNQSK